MREAKLYLVDLVSHCHEGTIARAVNCPGTSSCDCMWTCSRTAVAFLKAALLGLWTAQHLCSCCCIIHIEVFAFVARLWKLCCIVRPDLRYLKSHFLHLCSASILEVSHFHCWLFCWYASGGSKISLFLCGKTYIGSSLPEPYSNKSDVSVGKSEMFCS